MSGKDCPHTTSCALYPLLRQSGLLSVWQIRYCSADYTQCARYQQAAQGRQVPINLLPNGALLKHMKKDDDSQ